MRPTEAVINLPALIRNAQKLRSLVGEDAFFCPMVKANAYGHGAVQVAHALAKDGVEFVGVSLVEEGIELRKAGSKLKILVFGAFTDLDSARAIVEHSLTPVISSRTQLNALEQTSADKSISVHLKFDTGMNRLGFNVDQATAIRSHLAKVTNWTLEGVCTHLLNGDDANRSDGFTSKQLQAFQLVLKSFEGLSFYSHVFNSSGLVSLSQNSTGYGARPGIALYGGQDGFESVMTLKSQIITTREIPAGASVSYYANWTAKRKSTIGIVPIGYADGVARKFTNQLSVLVREQRVPVVGTVCMDYVMLDLTDLKSQFESLGEGEEVVFFGSQGRSEIRGLEWAQILDTIPYEIFTRISSRVPRNYVST